MIDLKKSEQIIEDHMNELPRVKVKAILSKALELDFEYNSKKNLNRIHRSKEFN